MVNTALLRTITVNIVGEVQFFGTYICGLVWCEKIVEIMLFTVEIVDI